jgi:hypothetical protein
MPLSDGWTRDRYRPQGLRRTRRCQATCLKHPAVLAARHPTGAMKLDRRTRADAEPPIFVTRLMLSLARAYHTPPRQSRGPLATTSGGLGAQWRLSVAPRAPLGLGLRRRYEDQPVAAPNKFDRPAVDWAFLRASEQFFATRIDCLPTCSSVMRSDQDAKEIK